MPTARVEPSEPEGDDVSALVSRAELKQLVEANQQLMARVEQLEQSSMKVRRSQPLTFAPAIADGSAARLADGSAARGRPPPTPRRKSRSQSRGRH